MVTLYLQRLRLFSRDVRLFLVSSSVIGFSYFGITSVLLNLFLLRLGYGHEFVGLVFAVGALTWAVVSLPAGALGRRWGIRRMMIVGLATMALGAGLLPCAEFVPQAWRSAWLVTTSALRWAGGAFFLVNGIPFLTGASGEEERSHVFSVWLGLVPLTAFAGGLVSGRLPALFAGMLRVSLDAPAPFRYPLWLAAALLIPAVLALLATREVTTLDAPAAEREAGPAPYGLLAVLGSVVLLRSGAVGAMESFFNVYLDADLRLPTPLIGTLMAAGQLLGAAAALAAPILMVRYGKRRAYILGCLGLALGLVFLALVPHWIAAGVAWAWLLAMASIVDPIFHVFSQEAVSPGWRPAASGAGIMAQGLSFMLVGLGGGRAITAFGYRTFFLLVAVPPVAGALLYWAYFRVPRGELARRSAPDGDRVAEGR